jgi:hypothetical protein
MIRAFISYSHADENYRNELQKHLMSLQHQGIVETWHDRRIVAGEEWAGCIDDELHRADIILLLVSSDFIASRYCYELEMNEALARHERGEAVVIPVILRSCNWTGLPFGKLQAATREGKAVAKYPSLDDAFLEITQNIEVIAKRLNKTTVTPLTVKPQATFQVSDLPRSANLAIPKTFSDHDKDTFVTDAFNYIALFFEGSLDELEKRNTGVTTRFEKVDTRSFEAVIYRDGKQVSQCGIWLGNLFGSRGTSSITYSSSGLGQKNSYNASISVKDNGNMLGLAPISNGKLLTNEGAAEYYWTMLFEPVQRRY